MTILTFFAATVVVASSMAFAQDVRSIDISIGQIPLAPRFATGKKTKLEKSLNEVQQHLDRGHYKSCYNELEKVRPQAKGIEPWLISQELRCRGQSLRKKRQDINKTMALLKTIANNPAWTSLAPYSSQLREDTVSVGIKVLVIAVRSHRKTAWELIHLLNERVSWMNDNEKADFYQYWGELSLIEQDVPAALFYFDKSLNSKRRNKLVKRFERLSNGHWKAKDEKTTREMPHSKKENDLYRRFKNAVASKDFLSAVEDGVSLIRDYPGSQRVEEVSDRIIQIYLAVANSGDSKLKLAKTRILTHMREADGDRLYDWAKVMVRREYYDDAMKTAQFSLEKVNGQLISTEILLLAAQSAYHVGDFSIAKSFYKKLETEHVGTSLSKKAVFQLGILSFRIKEYSEASAYFEKYLTFTEDVNTEISAMYWLWRSRQRLEVDKADVIAKELMRKYPTSYYALRARSELDKKFSLPREQGASSWTATLWLSGHEQLGWQRFELLLKGGWLEEARLELSALPTPSSEEGKLVWAKLWGQSMDYLKALEEVIDVWKLSNKHKGKEVLHLIYPKEFDSLVEAQAKRFQVSPNLVMSLIRQESTFRPEVVSPAGARGLMQILYATGSEIAKDMRMKSFDSRRDLFDPSINITIGTNYISRLIRNFKGHIPLALAAYNAGIGNIRNWLNSRRDLEGIMSDLNHSPESELWVEELPWEETTGYVKNILRNWVVYSLLEDDQKELKFPIWTQPGL